MKSDKFDGPRTPPTEAIDADDMQAAGGEAPPPGDDTPSDPVLIKRTLQGDKGAWIEMVRRYQDRVFAKAAANTPTAEEAAKLTRTVFVRAYKKLTELDDALKASAFLNAQMEEALAAVEEAKGSHSRPSVIRREKVRKACEAIGRENRSDTVYEYLRDLPQRFKTLIALKSAIDLGYEDISAFTGMAPTAVRGRLHQIKYKLARYLKGIDSPRAAMEGGESGDDDDDAGLDDIEPFDAPDSDNATG